MPQPTDQQIRAIQATGNVLLMAGAGTGKTRTLVERCLHWLFDGPEPGSLDRMLMVTFTEAAAAEMRNRIRAALEQRQAQSPGDERVAEQLALLDTAQIRTLHSFCFELARRHFVELELDPQVVVLDEQQTALLEREAMEEMLERHYGDANSEASAAVRRLIELAGGGWDKSVRELVRNLHRRIRTLPDPAAWLTQQEAIFNQPEPAQWRGQLVDGFLWWCEFWRPYIESVPADNPHARSFAGLLWQGPARPSLEAISQVLARIAELNDKKQWPPKKATLLREPIKKFLEEAEELRQYLPAEGRDPLAEDWALARPHMRCLLQLTREFDTACTATKRAQAALDFNDLEQLALQLLYPQSNPSRSTIAEYWREKFDRIFVDEYQDINAAQDAILRALSREGTAANRFLVGDVKQSIYRFRQADPRIFQDYARQWNIGGQGRVLHLSLNFRSHEAILDFVNRLFPALMFGETGGVRYDTDAALQFGDPAARAALSRAAEAPEIRRVELHLLVENKENGESAADESAEDGEVPASDSLGERTRLEHEACVVAQRLRQLKDHGTLVFRRETGTWSPAEWRDMVVLMRSPRGRAESFAKEFARAGVPLMAPRGGFFTSQEISDLVSLLQLLDNPRQDLPLLAVLRSPLVGLKLDDLAEIRTAARKGPYWAALLRWEEVAAKRGPPPPAWASVHEFLSRYRRWRELAQRGSLVTCLETILRETLFAEWCLAQERGNQRHANVLRLLDVIRQFDALQRQGLYRFLKFIEAHEEAELNTETAPVATENSVRLMSIHQSKGLEFPVVALAGMGVKFNEQDLSGALVFDEIFGLCPRIYHPDGASYPSISAWLARRRGRLDVVGEELRLLYVAMTRAVDRLLLFGVTTEKQMREHWPARVGIQPEYHRVLKAHCYLDWVGTWLTTGAGGEEWPAKIQGMGPTLAWQVHDFSAAAESVLAEDRLPPAGVELPADSASLTQTLAWRYPHPAATVEPAKTTVTQLRRRFARTANEAESTWARFVGGPGFERVRPGSRFMAADIGIAHHLFLQMMPLETDGSVAALSAQAVRMVTAGILTREQAEALDFAALAAFWQGPVGRQILARAASVQREVPFTVRLEADDLRQFDGHEARSLSAGDFVVAQGVADLLVLLNEEIWLLDFKTDRVTPETLPEKIQLYTPQLQLYALALQRIYQRPARHLWLHFLTARETATIPGIG